MDLSNRMPIIHFSGTETALMLTAVKAYFVTASAKKQKYYKIQLATLFAQLKTKHPVIHFELDMNNALIIMHAIKYLKHQDELKQFLNPNELKSLHSAYNKVSSYYYTNKALEITPKQLLKTLNHDTRLANHDFVQEALDDIFSGMRLNYKTGKIHYYSVLSALATNLTQTHAYGAHKNTNREFFIVAPTLVGLKNTLKQSKYRKIASPQIHDLYHSFKVLQNHHHKYASAITTFEHHKPVKLLIEPAHLDDCLAVIEMCKHYILNNIHNNKDND